MPTDLGQAFLGQSLAELSGLRKQATAATFQKDSLQQKKEFLDIQMGEKKSQSLTQITNALTPTAQQLNDNNSLLTFSRPSQPPFSPSTSLAAGTLYLVSPYTEAGTEHSIKFPAGTGTTYTNGQTFTPDANGFYEVLTGEPLVSVPTISRRYEVSEYSVPATGLTGFQIFDSQLLRMSHQSGDIRHPTNMSNLFNTVISINPSGGGPGGTPQGFGIQLQCNLDALMGLGRINYGGLSDINGTIDQFNRGVAQEIDSMINAYTIVANKIENAKRLIKALGHIELGVSCACISGSVGFDTGLDKLPVPGLPNFGLTLPLIPLIPIGALPPSLGSMIIDALCSWLAQGNSGIPPAGYTPPSSSSLTLPVTPQIPPPFPPSQLVSTISLSRTFANLEWFNNATNQSGFKIEVSRNRGPWVGVATTALQTYALPLVVDSKYAVRVKSIGEGGDSIASNEVRFTT